MPNAIEPNVAQINIAKFNSSAIALAFVSFPMTRRLLVFLSRPSEIIRAQAQQNISAILAENPSP
jgi:hypothetical protein